MLYNLLLCLHTLDSLASFSARHCCKWSRRCVFFHFTYSSSSSSYACYRSHFSESRADDSRLRKISDSDQRSFRSDYCLKIFRKKALAVLRLFVKMNSSLSSSMRDKMALTDITNDTDRGRRSKKIPRRFSLKKNARICSKPNAAAAAAVKGVSKRVGFTVLDESRAENAPDRIQVRTLNITQGENEKTVIVTKKRKRSRFFGGEAVSTRTRGAKKRKFASGVRLPKAKKVFGAAQLGRSNDSATTAALMLMDLQRKTDPPTKQQSHACVSDDGDKSLLETFGVQRVKDLLRTSGFRTDTTIEKAGLGEGSFGAVFKVRGRSKKRSYFAVKVCKTLSADVYSVEQNTKVHEEIRQCKHLCPLLSVHKEKARVSASGTSLCAVVMPYFCFGDLSKAIHQKKLGKVTVFRAATILNQLAEATQFLHDKGWIHTDIKPLNILVENILPLKIKLGDLGECSTREEIVMDKHPYRTTLHYRAPETILQKPHTFETAHAIDLWSVGTVVMEYLTEQVLFPGLSCLGKAHGPDVLEDIVRTIGMPSQAWLEATTERLPGRSRRMRQFFTKLPSGDWTMLPVPSGWEVTYAEPKYFGEFKYTKDDDLPPIPPVSSKSKRERRGKGKNKRRSLSKIKLKRHIQAMRPVMKSPSELAEDPMNDDWNGWRPVAKSIDGKNFVYFKKGRKVITHSPPVASIQDQVLRAQQKSSSRNAEQFKMLGQVLDAMLQWSTRERMSLKDAISAAEELLLDS